MKKQNSKLSLAFVFLFLSLNLSTAEAGRPLNTDDAGTVSPGIFEIETAYEYVDHTDDEHSLSLVLTTGLLDSLDIGVEIPYQFLELNDADNQNGISDVSLTTKWNAFSKEDLFDATLSFNYKSDNGNDEKSLGTGEAEFTILGILSKECADVTLHFNVGPTLVRDGDDVLNYNIAAEWSFSDRLTLVSELFGNHNLEDHFNDNPFSGLLGLTYAINENTVYDLGLTGGITSVEPDFKVTTGLTIAFGD